MRGKKITNEHRNSKQNYKKKYGLFTALSTHLIIKTSNKSTSFELILQLIMHFDELQATVTLSIRSVHWIGSNTHHKTLQKKTPKQIMLDATST